MLPLLPFCRRLLGKAARALLWDQPKEEPKEEEPVKIEPSPVYADSHKFVGPETPKVLYTTAPTPASYETATKVGRSLDLCCTVHKQAPVLLLPLLIQKTIQVLMLDAFSCGPLWLCQGSGK